VEIPFWSDRERPFIPWALGLAFNAKWLARRLGLVRKPEPDPATPPEQADARSQPTREERLRDEIERSRYEERR
jgi:hypothetical protein